MVSAVAPIFPMAPQAILQDKPLKSFFLWLAGYRDAPICLCVVVFVRKTVNESSVMLKKSALKIEEEGLIGAEGKLKKKAA